MRKLSSLAVLLVLAGLLCTGSAAFGFDKNHLMKFEAKKSCRECDLSGANLSGANLRGSNLSQAIYDSATQWPRGFELQSSEMLFIDL